MYNVLCLIMQCNVNSIAFNPPVLKKLGGIKLEVTMKLIGNNSPGMTDGGIVDPSLVGSRVGLIVDGWEVTARHD